MDCGGLVTLATVGSSVFGAGYNGALYVWDADTHAPAFEVVAHADAIRTLLPVGSQFVLSSSGSRDGTLALWAGLGEGQLLLPASGLPARRKSTAGSGTRSRWARRSGSSLFGSDTSTGSHSSGSAGTGGHSGNSGSNSRGAHASSTSGGNAHGHDGISGDAGTVGQGGSHLSAAARAAILDLPRAYDPTGFELILPLPEDSVDEAASLACALPVHALATARAWREALHEQDALFLQLWAHAAPAPAPLPRNDALAQLVGAGVPPARRTLLWDRLVHAWLDQQLDAPPFARRREFYRDLVWRVRNVNVQQVELDLHRTFPTNRYFNSVSSRGYQCLRRVLVAFSQHNVATGYCQGFNFITAFALLTLSEDVAFW